MADRHGRQLGFAALATLNDMEPAGNQLFFDRVVESGAPLAVWRHQPHEHSSDIRSVKTVVDLKIKNWPTADELQQQESKCEDRALKERLRRKREIRRALGDGSSFPLAVYAWRIGDAVLVGSGGEAYSRLQRELRVRFPSLTMICMNLINGSVGYLPPADLYDVDAYPVWQTPFDRGCLERIGETMAGAIEELLD